MVSWRQSLTLFVIVQTIASPTLRLYANGETNKAVAARLVRDPPAGREKSTQRRSGPARSPSSDLFSYRRTEINLAMQVLLRDTSQEFFKRIFMFGGRLNDDLAVF